MARQREEIDDNKRDQNAVTNAAYGATGAAGLTAIGNQLHRQIIGNRLLQMMYDSQEGRKILKAAGAAPLMKNPDYNKKPEPPKTQGSNKSSTPTAAATPAPAPTTGPQSRTTTLSTDPASVKTSTEPTPAVIPNPKRTRRVNARTVKASATEDPRLREQIQAIVAEEMDRIKAASEKVTKPADAAIKANNDSVIEAFKKASPFAEYNISNPGTQSEAFNAFNKYHPNVTYDNANPQHRKWLESAWRKDFGGGEAPDLSNPEHMKWLKAAGYMDANAASSNTVPVEKAMNRQQIKVEKEAAANKQSGGTTPIDQYKIDTAQQKINTALNPPDQTTIDVNRSVLGDTWNNLQRAREQAQGPIAQQVDEAAGSVREHLASKLPAIAAKRRELIRQYNAAVKGLGPKPQAGTSNSSRQALKEWNAKNAAITEMKSQLDLLDQVVTKTGKPAPAKTIDLPDGGTRFVPSVEDILTGNSGITNNAVAKAIATNLPPTTKDPSDPTGSRTISGPQRFEVPVTPDPRVQHNRNEYFDFLGQTNALQQQAANPQRDLEFGQWQLAQAQAPYAPYEQPRELYRTGVGGAPDLTYEVPGAPFNTGGRDPYANLGIRANVIPEQAPPTQSAPLFDTNQFTDWLKRYNTALTGVQPRTTDRELKNLGRLKAVAGARRTIRPDVDTGLLARISKLFGGNVTPSAAANASHMAASEAQNIAAIDAFAKSYPHPGRVPGKPLSHSAMPDMTNPEHVDWLKKHGWTEPSSALEQAADGSRAPIGGIELPQNAWQRKSQAFDAGRELGLKTGNLNPTLIGGKRGRGVGYAASTALGLLPMAGIWGYNKLTEGNVEKEIANEQKQVAATQSKAQAKFVDRAAMEEKAIKIVNKMIKAEGGHALPNRDAMIGKTMDALRSTQNKELKDLYASDPKTFENILINTWGKAYKSK